MVLRIFLFTGTGSLVAWFALISIFCLPASRSFAALPIDVPGSETVQGKQTPASAAQAAQSGNQDHEKTGRHGDHSKGDALPADNRGTENNMEIAGESPDPQGHQQHAGHTMTGMSMMDSIAGGPFKSMNAIGSGTSLLPASSPGYMWHLMRGNWMFMFHGNLVAGINHQGEPRGVTKAESLNWFMVMAEHPVKGGGVVLLKGMFSGEPFTSPNGGFPQLLQTGETWRGRPIIDAQHPHDLLMELSANLTMPLSKFASVYVYGGPVAEPALGPVAFMHRLSASETPSAPLGHHWEDSTHISFGVFTGGVNLWRFRLEGSVFNGREPDEDRKDIDLARMNSLSARVWFTPAPNWAMQYSHGHLRDPEVLEPGTVERNTVSVSYTRPWENGWSATTLIWGRNHEARGNSNAYLFESTANFLNKNYLFTRLELIDKAGLLEENIFGRQGLDPFIQTGSGPKPGAKFDQSFRVGTFTFGGVRDVIAGAKLRVGVGANLTSYHLPHPLEQIYGSRPISIQFWVRLKPGRMEH